MRLYEGLIRLKTFFYDPGTPDPAELYEGPDDDTWWDFGRSHVPNTMTGEVVEYNRAGDLPPPIRLAGARDVIINEPTIEVKTAYQKTRYATGPHDLEPMIPEGEVYA